MVGSDPLLTMGTLRTAIRKPYFGSSPSLAQEDFNAAASDRSVRNFSQINTYWYSATLNSSGLAYVNKTGLTQFRLYFSTPDNANGVSDYMKFSSGNSSAGYQPQLLIMYILP